MASDSLFILLGGLLVLAFLAEEAFRLVRVPPVLVLMACGMILGQAAHLLPAEELTSAAPHFGALAFLLILFERGLDLNVHEVARNLRAEVGLAVLGFALAFVLAMTAAVAFGMAVPRAAVFGIVVAPISGSIVLPLAGKLGLREDVRTTVVIEAALADVLAVLAMGAITTMQRAGGLGGLVAVGSLFAAALSVIVALVVALLWPRVLRRLGDRRFLDALTFGVALVLWGLVQLPGASGALAVLAFGLVLANERELLEAVGMPAAPVAEVTHQAVRRLHAFIAELTFLVRAFFFVFLAVVVRFAHLAVSHYLLAAILVAALLLARRLTLDFVESRGVLAFTQKERSAVVMLQPRGLVSAVLAIEAGALGVDDRGVLLGVASIVILLTNLLLIGGARRIASAVQVPQTTAE